MKYKRISQGDKVRVKKGLGMISGKEGYVVEIKDEWAVVNFPYWDIRKVRVEDLERVSP